MVRETEVVPPITTIEQHHALVVQDQLVHGRARYVFFLGDRVGYDEVLAIVEEDAVVSRVLDLCGMEHVFKWMVEATKLVNFSHSHVFPGNQAMQLLGATHR
jgi:hypothetical protein